MFPLGSGGGTDPDIIRTGGGDRRYRRWRRYAVAGGVLALAGTIAAVSISSASRHAAERPPSRATPGPVIAVPSTEPSQAWVTSLNIAIWPMPGTRSGGLYSSMFAGGVAGTSGWELTLRDITRPGEACAAAVVLYGSTGHPIAAAYPLSLRPSSRTSVGGLAFLSLGGQSAGVGVAFLQVASLRSGALVSADPDRVGGLEISVPVLAMRACGQQYYLAGFAYPLAGTLDLLVSGNDGPTHYLVPTRLSRPRVSRVWEGAE